MREGATPTGVAFCDPPEGQPQPVLTLGLIRSAFAELRLPAGALVIQPPDGTTLVNFDTNFYTSATAPLTRTVTLLGQRVTLEATPSRYRWEFGDGTVRTTSEPGSPYPRLDVTHNYLRTGTYRPRLATTYTGRYRVAGGGWRPIPGTVTVQGAPRPLRAIEARPTLVPYE
ncbi:PKD domain-containing protein [Nocardioides sp. LML1-1-1.1]|uniref:PKD domain-containing protein n=1 Tax=Nocardioides sp. LML1-1-1.1 TaxID=3135248 RepID=UPI0034336D8B